MVVLSVNYVAAAMGLPFLPPYLENGRSFKQGANFAFSGATALEPEFFRNKGLGPILWTNISLSAQLKWFEELKPSLCGSIKGSEKLIVFLSLIMSLSVLEFNGNYIVIWYRMQ